MSVNIKEVVGIGAVVAGTTAVLAAGSSVLTDEPKHHPGDGFTSLAKLQLAVGGVAAGCAAIAAACALFNGHSAASAAAGAADAAEYAQVSQRWTAGLGGVTAGILGGRLLADSTR